MKKDYHLHPFVHSRPGMLDSFIQRAMELGFDEICITDHMPVPQYTGFPDRIPVGGLALYAEKVREAAQRYSGRISVKCGIEVDHAPDLKELIRENLASADFDCILGSTHPNLIRPDPARTSANRSEYAAVLLQNALDAARSGQYHILTHIDIYRRLFARAEELRFSLPPDDFHPRQQERLLRELFHVLREQGMRLEINASLNPKHKAADEVHPDPWILMLAQDMGVHFSFGSDAHAVDDVGLLYEELKQSEIYASAMRDWEA